MTQILAVQLMPLSVAVSIMMMTVFTTSILAWVVLGDRLTLWEIFTIIMGTFGMFMFANPTVFSQNDAQMVRAKADQKEYPYYTLGLVIAISVTIFMALEFLAMSNLKGHVHSSWKTFSLGLLCTVGAIVYALIEKPQTFLGFFEGKPTISWDQFGWSCVVGFFSWACLESKSLALTSVKSGTVTCFTNLSLVVSFITDITYYERSVLWPDIVGGSILIIFTTANGILANINHEARKK